MTHDTSAALQTPNSPSRSARDRVLNEFPGQTLTEDEGCIVPNWVAMADALVETRAERTTLQGALDLTKQAYVQFTLNSDTLRAQLAAAHALTDATVDRPCAAYANAIAQRIDEIDTIENGDQKRFMRAALSAARAPEPT